MAQIGIMLEGQMGLNWERWDRILKVAEESGYQCLFRSDHFTSATGAHDDALECWTSLTYAAANTKRIEIGPLVTPITFRHPAMIVQQAAAVDVLSGGRLVLGMGIGWQVREHSEYGINFPGVPTRYEMLVDGLEFAKRLFSDAVEVSYQGQHFSLDKTKIMMKRPGGPKILIGGNGPKKTLPLAAKYAEEWNAVYADHETFTARNNRLNELLEQEGRRPDEVKRSLMIRLLYRHDEARLNADLKEMGRDKADLAARGYIVGSASEIIDQLGKWTELGVQRFMLQWLDLDDMDSLQSLAEAVLPHFHK